MSTDLEMSGKSLNLFNRSICPNCDAYNNWEVLGNEYVCLSCNGKYRYADGKLYNLSGDLIDYKEKEYIESHPYYKILSAIDIQNHGYWLHVFRKFDETGKYRKWNWPSFFFDIYRYFWKGLWKKGLIIYVIGFLAGVFIGFLFLQDITKFKISEIFIIVGIKIYLGYCGSEDYYKFIKHLGEDVGKAKRERKIGRILFFVIIIFTITYNVFLG